MKLLLDYIRHYVRLSQNEETVLTTSFKTKRYSKGNILINEGEVCEKLFFILKGTCRTAHDHPLKEVTTWIYPEGYFLTAWSSFIMGSPSLEMIQVLEDDSEVAFITKPTLNQLYEEHRTIERFGRLLAEEQLALMDDYSRGYSLMSAKEKYETLLSFFPDVIQRVNLGYVASMLGITQETLSRIRRQD